MDPEAEAKDFLLFAHRGSPEALARVFDALAPRLLLIAGHLTRDAARAEDLVQTTFLQAMRDARRYDGTRPIGAWLRGSCATAPRTSAGAALRATEPLKQETLSGALDPADAAADAELYERVVAAALALDEPYRAVLTLRIVHGLEPVALTAAAYLSRLIKCQPKGLFCGSNAAGPISPTASLQPTSPKAAAMPLRGQSAGTAGFWLMR